MAPPRLRSWEEAGLLHPRRLPNAARLCSTQDIVRARLIKRSLVRPGRRGSLRHLAAALDRGELQPIQEDFAGLDARPGGDRAFRAMFEAMPELVVACDAEGALIGMNAALRAVRCIDDPVLSACLLPDTLEDLPLRWTARTGTNYRGLALALCGPHDPAMLTLWSVSPPRADDGRPYGAVGVGRAAVTPPTTQDDWLAVAAHDLRGPVTARLGWAQFALQAPAKLRSTEYSAAAWVAAATKLDGYLARLDVSTKDLISLMDTVLDATAAASGNFLRHLVSSSLELTAVARESVAPAQAHTSRHMITLEAPPAPFPMMGDRVRLRQLLDNVPANAIKYAPDGGPITVRLEAAPALPGVDGDGSAGGADQWAVLRVTDTGLGIPAEAVPRVFERFWRAPGATRQLRGSGPGLYACRAIAIAHGGDIAVERSVLATDGESAASAWHGTVMRLALPLAGGSARAGAPARARDAARTIAS